MNNAKSTLKGLLLTALTLCLPGLFISCASDQHELAVPDTVGPGADLGGLAGGHGYLQVWSATKPVRLKSGATGCTHTSYEIEAPDGRRVQWVMNRIDDMDETPELVELPAGRYQVVAQTAHYGRLCIPVAIEPHVTTKIHLEGPGSWQPQMPPKDDGDLVRLPDGEAIGWHELAGK